ncbi:PRELI domain-containing protein 2 isoform X3 [Paramormyrops kingsleyae]|uniref:PRELI domain-containing protein 2 isoform X3 n=1 Tax=Paramormyrops kingsleyae TaxID=1676925 RepID=UPI000CD60046|nr:PRELI domain-containing protein 2 isoform X3 [Paramormyrops kingsleyae]XP_023698171.1 PRELI domain-containing protein 2 isoform X3 [Paramormyrops kingsleyae]
MVTVARYLVEMLAVGHWRMLSCRCSVLTPAWRPNRLQFDGLCGPLLSPWCLLDLQLTVMDVDDVFLEEESWLDLKQKTMNIKSRCLTWTQFATLQEVSVFKESPANPNWTEFFQKGSVTVTGVGRLNRLFELFAQSFFSKGVQKSVQVMETILEQKFGHPCS